MIAEFQQALAGHEWLAEAAGRVANDPDSIAVLFPVAARQCGRTPLDGGWSTDEAARAVLLSALPLTGAELAVVVRRLYDSGDAAERRAVLKTLPELAVGSACVDLLLDALRTNDSRLVAAAMGPYARHLSAEAWRQGVLKCVFMNIPLASVHDLGRRADADLGVMLGGLAQERRAAGRTIPDDALALLDSLT